MAAVVVVAVIGALAIVVDTDDTDDTDDGAVSPVNSGAVDDVTSPGTASSDDGTPVDGSAGSGPAITADAGATAPTSAPAMPAVTTVEGPATAPGATTAFPPVAPVEPTCTYLGLDDFDDMQVELSFVNPLGSVPSLQLDYALSDVDDVRFHTGTAAIDLPGAEESFRIAHDTVEALPVAVVESSVSCRVLDISEGFGSPDVRPPGGGDGCTVAGIDGFGDIQIEVMVTNPFATETEILLTYALTTTDGVRFASAASFVDSAAAGETVRLPVDTVTAPPPWANEVECRLLGIEALDL